MSLDEGASLHEAFKEVMVRLTGTRIFGDGSVYWAVPYFVLLSATGLFMLRGAHRCPAAVACLLCAGTSYAVAVVAQFEYFLGNHPAIETWIEESTEMLGGLLILMTLGLHARTIVIELEQVTYEDARVDVASIATNGRFQTCGVPAHVEFRRTRRSETAGS